MKSNILTSLMLGTSLFGGFVSGMTLSPAQLQHLNPFRTETLSFGKIAWISHEKSREFKTAVTDVNLSAELPLVASAELTFVPYAFKPGKHSRFSSIFRPKKGNFLKLAQAVERINEATRYDAYSDFQIASTRLRNEFAFVMNKAPPTPPHEMIAMTSSSAETPGVKKEELPLAPPANEMVPAETAKVEPAISERKNLERSETKSAPAVSETQSYEEQAALAELQISEDPLARAMENVAHGRAVSEAATPVEAPLIENEVVSAPPATGIQKSQKSVRNENVDATPTEDTPIVTVDRQNSAIMAALLNSQKLNSQNATVTSAAVPREASPIPALKRVANPSPTSSNTTLAASDKQNLSEALLDTQLKSAQQAKRSTVASNPSPPSPLVSNIEEPESLPLITAAKPALAANSCQNNLTQQFIKAGGSAPTDVAIQVCPKNLTWLSKSTSSSAWLKVEDDDNFPTLTLEPAPNNGPTLLLDQNALGLISIKSGVHVTKGMGIVLGIVPDGYKVNFTGRAEETEYFESTGHQYFAILNAEPGAGVVEIESKTNPNLSSTVFAPILGDVITYLDLAAPVVTHLKIKVLKNGTPNDPEVSKLTVALSTQSGLQAITRADGQATLNNVNLVPGFPVFVDVASRSGDADSFTYRYEIKHPESGNIFLANEVSETSIRHWLKQVGTGLSEQSAMVIGLYDRKKLNGFQSIHYSQVEPLTAKFGLDPINYSVLWNGVISTSEPLEGDLPRFMSVQVPEGLSNVKLLNELHEVEASELFPISSRVIHVISN